MFLVNVCIGLAVLGGFFGISYFLGKTTQKGKDKDIVMVMAEGAMDIITVVGIILAAWLIGWCLVDIGKMIIK